MRKLYPFIILALATVQSASAISQYELENKPTQYQVAYNSPSETVYIDLSTISLAQAGATYSTLHARTISLYKNQNIIADYSTNYTYHRGNTSKDIYLMDWHIAPAKFYQVNGAPIGATNNERSVLSTGAHGATKGSAIAEIGQFILHNALELERITYTFTNPYVPPRPYKPINTPPPTASKPLFGVQPPKGVYKPLNQLESPYTSNQPRLFPSKLGMYGPVPAPPPQGPRPSDWILDIQNQDMPDPNTPMSDWRPQPDYHAPQKP